jgi:hypothetical protein
MDTTIQAAWIGVAGTLGGTVAGVLLGSKLTAVSEHRAARSAVTQQLAGLRQYLYHPKDVVDLTVELDRLGASLAGGGIDMPTVDALRKVSLACNASSWTFAAANPDNPPAVSESLLGCYTQLIDALSQVLRRNGRRRVRRRHLAQAVHAITALNGA